MLQTMRPGLNQEYYYKCIVQYVLQSSIVVKHCHKLAVQFVVSLQPNNVVNFLPSIVVNLQPSIVVNLQYSIVLT